MLIIYRLPPTLGAAFCVTLVAFTLACFGFDGAVVTFFAALVAFF